MDTLAVDIVYKGAPADGPQPKLDSAHLHRAEPVIEERLEKLGVRLAEMLISALARESKWPL